MHTEQVSDVLLKVKVPLIHLAVAGGGALLRYCRMLWSPSFTTSCGGKVMGQCLRFRPPSVATFPERDGQINDIKPVDRLNFGADTDTVIWEFKKKINIAKFVKIRKLFEIVPQMIRHW